MTKMLMFRRRVRQSLQSFFMWFRVISWIDPRSHTKNHEIWTVIFESIMILSHQGAGRSVGVPDYLLGFVDTHWLGEEVTLAAVTEQLPQQGHLLLSLDALGHHIHSQVFRQHQNRANDFNIFLVIHNASDERTVDL